MPVFDAITLADYVCTSRTDNPRFGATFGRNHPKEERDDAIKASLPAIGILRIEYDYPPAPGDVDHPSSYHYRTYQEVAKGLTFEAAQAGVPLTAAQKAEFDAAISRLETIEKVVGITGDCGFLMNYQREARRQATLTQILTLTLALTLTLTLTLTLALTLPLTPNPNPSFDSVSAELVHSDVERTGSLVWGAPEPPTH